MRTTCQLKYELVSEDIITPEPTYASGGAAGIDLYSVETVSIVPGKITKIKTNIRVAIPTGYYGQLFGRSGLALNKGIVILGGVIDSDYRGEICILAGTLLNEEVIIKAGERAAQMIILPVLDVWIGHGDVKNDETARGDRGFGSTGST